MKKIALQQFRIPLLRDQVYSVPTQVNTNQHESARVQHESTRVRHESTRARHESTRINTSQHESDHEIIIVYPSLVGKL